MWDGMLWGLGDCADYDGFEQHVWNRRDLHAVAAERSDVRNSIVLEGAHGSQVHQIWGNLDCPSRASIFFDKGCHKNFPNSIGIVFRPICDALHIIILTTTDNPKSTTN